MRSINQNMVYQVYTNEYLTRDIGIVSIIIKELCIKPVTHIMIRLAIHYEVYRVIMHKIICLSNYNMLQYVFYIYDRYGTFLSSLHIPINLA